MQKKDFLPNRENTGGENRNAIFLVTYAIVLIVALLNMNATMSFLGWVFAILNPFLIGLVIAFVINIIMTKLETNVFKFLDKPKFKLWHKMKRGVCLTLSFLLIILVITALLFFIGPQLADSVRTLSNNIPSYISYLQELTNDVLAYFDLSADELGIFAINWRDVFTKAADFLANVSPGVITFASGFTSAVFNFFMGLIFAVYLLTGKEKLILNFKRLLYADLPESKVNTFLSVGDMTNSIFTGFVVGQLTEAVILGTMYFIGTSIFPDAVCAADIGPDGGLQPNPHVRADYRRGPVCVYPFDGQPEPGDHLCRHGGRVPADRRELHLSARSRQQRRAARYLGAVCHPCGRQPARRLRHDIGGPGGLCAVCAAQKVGGRPAPGQEYADRMTTDRRGD